MAEETEFQSVTLEGVMTATEINRQIATPLLAGDPAVIVLTLKNSATDERFSRRIRLTKTVAELLLFNAPNLFPDVPKWEYRVQDFVVTLARTNHVLIHSRTLRDAGVQDYDTLKIVLGPASNMPA